MFVCLYVVCLYEKTAAKEITSHCWIPVIKIIGFLVIKVCSIGAFLFLLQGYSPQARGGCCMLNLQDSIRRDSGGE